MQSNNPTFFNQTVMPLTLTAYALDAVYVLTSTVFGYIGGEVLLNNGVATALVSGIIALVLGGLRTIITLRRIRLQEFTVIEQRVEQLHDQEKIFLQNQITYLEQLEKANRERLHAVSGETQRCVMHIRACEDLCKDKVTLPSFQVRRYEDIVAKFPLPDPPLPQIQKG